MFDIVLFVSKFGPVSTSIDVTGAGLALYQSYLRLDLLVFFACFRSRFFDFVVVLLMCEVTYLFYLLKALWW